MDQLEIVLALIEQDGVYYLQYRSGPKSIGAAKMIGCFGGKVNSGEDPALAICRELSEETSLDVQPDQIDELGVVNVVSDYQLAPIRIMGRIYHVVVDSGVNIEAREGDLISLSQTEALGRLSEMTPGTQACFEQFVKENNVRPN